MKGVYIFLAEGFEVTEALATVDVIRRGGIDIKTVSINEDKTVASANGITAIADMSFGEFKSGIQYDGTTGKDIMIFPGGMPGSTNLAESGELMEIMHRHFAEGGAVAAICAAPSVVLGKLDNIKGRKMTCYDGFEAALKNKGVIYSKDGVVTDGNIITGRGPGLSIDFGSAIVAYLKGPETAEEVRKGMML